MTLHVDIWSKVNLFFFSIQVLVMYICGYMHRVTVNAAAWLESQVHIDVGKPQCGSATCGYGSTIMWFEFYSVVREAAVPWWWNEC